MWYRAAESSNDVRHVKRPHRRTSDTSALSVRCPSNGTGLCLRRPDVLRDAVLPRYFLEGRTSRPGPPVPACYQRIALLGRSIAGRLRLRETRRGPPCDLRRNDAAIPQSEPAKIAGRQGTLLLTLKQRRSRRRPFHKSSCVWMFQRFCCVAFARCRLGNLTARRQERKVIHSASVESLTCRYPFP